MCLVNAVENTTMDFLRHCTPEETLNLSWDTAAYHKTMPLWLLLFRIALYQLLPSTRRVRCLRCLCDAQPCHKSTYLCSLLSELNPFTVSNFLMITQNQLAKKARLPIYLYKLQVFPYCMLGCFLFPPARYWELHSPLGQEQFGECKILAGSTKKKANKNLSGLNSFTWMKK